MSRRLLAGALLSVAILAACGNGKLVARGMVVEVDGDLATVRSFVIVDRDGERLRFVPEEGLLFHGSAPLSHIGDHLRSGLPIEVAYEEAEDGTLIAVEVGDG